MPQTDMSLFKLLVAKLLNCRNDKDPSVDLLSNCCPELPKYDWVNRLHWRAWDKVASEISTVELEWLTKSLVMAEREYRWGGGSVAAPIWLYSAYSKRRDGDSTRLANWIFRHSSNSYLPFGTSTSARSLEEYHAERKHIAERRRLRQEQEEFAKAERIRLAKEKRVRRKREYAQRKKRLRTKLARLRSMPHEDRLAAIADEDDLPLEAIPNDLLNQCLVMADHLPNEVRQKLLQRMDRRNRGIWKALRLKLD